MENAAKLKKNFLYNTIGSGFYLGCQWLVTILGVRMSGYDDAGILSLAISITNVFASVAFYGMRSYQVSDLKPKYQIGEYVASRVITSALALVLCVVFVLLNPYTIYESLCIILYMVFKLSEAAVDILHGIDQKLWRLDIAGRSYIARGFLSLAAFTLIMLSTGNLLLSIIGMLVCGYIVIIFYDVIKTRGLVGSVKPDFSFENIKKLLTECFPLLILLLLASFLPMIPRYLLELHYGNEIIGIYGSVATPTIVIQVAATFVFTPLIPLFAEHRQKGNHRLFIKLFNKSLIVIGALSIVALIVGVVGGDPILRLLFGNNEIARYTYLFVPVIICTILTAFCWFLNTILTVFRNFKALIIGNAAGFVFCGVLSLLLVKPLGMDGVNYSLLAALTVQSIVLLAYVLKRLNKKNFDSDKLT
jgi:O-antigen/teichoic acid export membrane protein